MNSRDLYVALITLVDDYARYEANPQLLRHEAFPLDDEIRTSQVSVWLEEIRVAQLAYFYTHAGKTYLSLTNWTEVPRYDSRLPEPPQAAREMGCAMNDRPKKGETGRSPSKAGLKTGRSQLPITSNQASIQEPVSGAIAPDVPQTGSSRAEGRITEPNAPPALEPQQRQDRSNSVNLAVAQAVFAEINARERSVPEFKVFTRDEVEQAWHWFESNKDADTGQWVQPFSSRRLPIGDWRSAMMERIGHSRNSYAKRNANSNGPARGEDTRDHAAGF